MLPKIQNGAQTMPQMQRIRGEEGDGTYLYSGKQEQFPDARGI